MALIMTRFHLRGNTVLTGVVPLGNPPATLVVVAPMDKSPAKQGVV